eukprot:jgi/Mesvir1/4354/Mv26090-RA.1
MESKEGRDETLRLLLEAWGFRGPIEGSAAVASCEVEPPAKDLLRLIEVMNTIGLPNGVVIQVMQIVAPKTVKESPEVVSACTSPFRSPRTSCEFCECAGVRQDRCIPDVSTEIEKCPLLSDPELVRWLTQTFDMPKSHHVGI